MRRATLALGLFLACSAEKPAPPAKPTPLAPAPDRPASQREITIDSVEIANPLIVTGRARTFENNVVLRARDENGALITETFTTATGDMGHHNPYRGTIWITRDPGDRVIVEALEYSAKDGSERSLFRSEKPFDVERIATTLHFPDENCTRVAAFRRPIPKSISMARLVVEALIAGPIETERKAGAAQAFPREARVESINLRDGVLTVDFNAALQNVGGSCRARMIRDSVTQTLRTLPSVEKVVITAGGSETLALQP